MNTKENSVKLNTFRCEVQSHSKSNDKVKSNQFVSQFRSSFEAVPTSDPLEVTPRKRKKYPYPKSIIFIVSNEFCERFSYYGMRTILSLFLRDKLGYDDDGATVIYHIFSMFVYFFPLFGAIIADSWLGKFKTIFYLSIVYAAGNILLSLTAMPPLNIPQRVFTMIGLLLVAVGTGGIKPCVSSFGGDQFKMPQQLKQLASFFSLFYFAINSGSLISTFLTPILRQDVHCFGETDCYSLAFGVPGALMIASIFVFVIGKSLYIIKKPAGNIITEVTKCMSHAISRKIKSSEKREHWLDHAADKYDFGLIEDIKAVLRVLILFIPVPVFWALFDQQGSRWTFQATRMNGEIGNWVLKPDQMQVVNPLLILILLPLFEIAIYPALTWCRLIKKPLHKMIWGGILASLAFVLSGLVEVQLEKTYPVNPTAGLSQLRVYNAYPCDFSLNMNGTASTISSLSVFEEKYIETNLTRFLPYTITGLGNCQSLSFNGQFEMEEKQAISYVIGTGNTLKRFVDESDKSSNGYPAIRLLSNIEGSSEAIQVVLSHPGDQVSLKLDSNSLERQTILPAQYNVSISNTTIMSNLKLSLGGVYVLILHRSTDGTYTSKIVEIAQPNSLHMLWLIPQYVVITMGEVMFSVTGLEFSFTQAPVSMKSVLTSMWLLTVAFGNLIVVIIAEVQAFDSQAKEFFLFAGLMFADILLFTFMAFRYKYVKLESEDNSETGDFPLPETKFEKTAMDNLAFNAN